MRNFYSLLIALLAVCGLAQAQTTVTFTAGTDVYPSTEAGAHSLTKDGVTIAVSNGTFGRTDNFRVYKGQTLQVSSTAGNIQKIVMVCTSTNAASNFTAIEGLTIDGNDGIWTGSATEVTFEASGAQVRMTSVEVTLGSTDPNFVAKPTITPASGTYYDGNQQISISAEEGATIHYTINGEEAVYSDPFTFGTEGEFVVTAWAEKNGNKSDVATATYTIAKLQAMTIAQLIEAGAADQATTAGTVYAAYDMGLLLGDGTGYIFVYGSNTLSVGDQVVVTGKVSSYGGCLQLSNAEISKTGTTTVSYPSFREIDGAALDALVAAPAVTPVKVKGTLTSVGNYKNFTVEGATVTGSILASSAVMGAAAVGNEIEVTGFFVYQSGSGKYGNIVATEVKVLGGTEVEIKEYTDLAAVKKAIQEGSTDMVKYTFKGLTVVAASGKNVYVTDGKNGICLYANNAKELKGGDKISGYVEGQLASYSGLEEINVSDNYANVTVDSEGNEVVPQTIGLDELSTADASAFQSLLVTVKGVKFQAEQMASRSVTIKDEDELEFTVYDSFNTISSMVFDTDATYNVTGVVTFHNGYQLAPRTTDDVVKAGEANLQTPESAWSVESVSTTVGGTVEATFTTTSDGAVTYTSSNEAVVKVDANGKMTVVGAGSATIVAETAATATFKSSSAALKVVVTSGADGTIEKPYTVADLLAFDAQSTSENVAENVWVKGYIVGFVNGSAMTDKDGNSNVVFSAADAVASNIVIADAANETVMVAPVALQNKAAARTDLNLADHADNLGKQVWLMGNIRKYMGVTGLRDVTDYSLDGQTVVAVRSIAADAAADGAIYNLAGQRVSKAVRGLYIVNGKKVAVK